MQSPPLSPAAAAQLDVADVNKLKRLSVVDTSNAYSKRKQHDGSIKDWFTWYTSWAIPGLGMFSEAYIIFSLGLTKPLQAAMFPSCFQTHTDCPQRLTHVQNYIQILGIIVGMLVFGVLGDVIGRQWGSRAVATIMLTGTLLLTAAPVVTHPATYLNLYIFAATWYGFGVGGEYPLASASAAERSQADESIRAKRGQQVVLTFSGQGMGSLVNGCVILILMAMLQLTGSELDPTASRHVVILQFAVGAAVSVAMVAYRFLKLKESKVWEAEKHDFDDLADAGAHPSDPTAPHIGHIEASEILRVNALQHFWPRLVVTCGAWMANDFAFYGNKLFQSTFIALLYPKASPFERMQWGVLNSAVSLCGYFAAAAVVDNPRYGRRRMQCVGFLAMAVLFGICGAAYPSLLSSSNGLMAFQALYFLSSFWNQFGPNCTTWLVAAEVFPTDVRTTFQGTSAAAGKVGAILADVLFSYVTGRTTFLLSAAFGLLGAALTWVFLPDTTGMSLDELDRMAKYCVAGEFEHYHGEAIHPKHLSVWERYVLKWDRNHNPVMDRVHSFVQTRNSLSWRARNSLELVEQEGSHPLLLHPIMSQDAGVEVDGDQPEVVIPAEVQLAMAASKGVDS